MQFLSLLNGTTLSQLAQRVGTRNVSSILGANGLPRTKDIGRALSNKINDLIRATPEPVTWQRKYSLLNKLSDDKEIFEYACMMGEDSWKAYSALGTFPGMVKIPETITLPLSADILGNGEKVPKDMYDRIMSQLASDNHAIDNTVFAEPTVLNGVNIYNSNERSLADSAASKSVSAAQWFNLPWGKITLYSSLSNSSMDIPAYPESLSDGRTATYDTMPDMLYQYEPWQVYSNSGPRSITYEFDLHRDMWSGNHLDGKCNELLRFCEANTFPEYKGSAVIPSTVTLYINGSSHIHGVLTEARTDWDGPIGQDGFYLHVKLSLTIIEVSQEPLSHSVVLNKGLIS